MEDTPLHPAQIYNWTYTMQHRLHNLAAAARSCRSSVHKIQASIHIRPLSDCAGDARCLGMTGITFELWSRVQLKSK